MNETTDTRTQHMQHIDFECGNVIVSHFNSVMQMNARRQRGEHIPTIGAVLVRITDDNASNFGHPKSGGASVVVVARLHTSPLEYPKKK